MEEWYNVYLRLIKKSGGPKEYSKLKISQKTKLLNILRKYSGNGKIIETGCGTGLITSALANEGYNVTGIDIDKNILLLAQNLEKEIYSKNSVNYKEQSIFELNYEKNTFDLCYSVGVLEHFEDDQIINSLSQQIKIAKTTIVVIPTRWFNDEEALHGDDRFLKLSYWRSLIKKSNGKIIKEASYPFKGKAFSKFVHFKRLLRPKAYRIFIIKKDNKSAE